jgi:hypothetical protein
MSKEYQVVMGVFSALLAGRAIVIVLNAILENAPTRFGAKELFTFLFPWDYALSFFIGFPIILSIFRETTKEREWWQPIAWENRNKYIKEIIEKEKLIHAVIGGIFLGWVLFFIDKCLLLVLEHYNLSISGAILNFYEWIHYSFDVAGSGYFDVKENTIKLASGHLAGTSFLIISGLLFFITGIIFRPYPNFKQSKYEAPVLIYISTLFALIVPIFGTATFILDKSSFPVFTTFILFSILCYRVFNVDYYFDLKEEKNNADISLQSPDNFSEALNARLKNQSNEKRTLVVVTASGGGIHAAGWTAQVLTGLQEELGEDFTKSIGLISSVSGGSVGTMYFLDNCEENGCPKKENLEKILHHSVQDGLDAVGWGIVYRDFWQFVGIPKLIIDTLSLTPDRGTALEKNWQGLMKEEDASILTVKNPIFSRIRAFLAAKIYCIFHPWDIHEKTKQDLIKKENTHIMLSDWRKKIFKGEIPTPVFNATLVEDGRRILISPMTFSTSKNDTIIDSNTLYQRDGKRYDMKAVTAARLSATFPYVSPSPRAARFTTYSSDKKPRTSLINITSSDNKESNYHIIDGGYFDNSGVATAIEWLDDKFEILTQNCKVERLVFIEIEAGAVRKEPEVKGDGGWGVTFLGPIKALMSVRDSSLTLRNTQAIELLLYKYRSKLDQKLKVGSNSHVQYLRINFPDRSKSRKEKKVKPKIYQRIWYLITNKKIVKEESQCAKYSQPLSWKLTASQKYVLREAWEDIKSGKNEQEYSPTTIAELREVWHKDWKFPAP